MIRALWTAAVDSATAVLGVLVVWLIRAYGKLTERVAHLEGELNNRRRT